jgi:uncharacterized protein
MGVPVSPVLAAPTGVKERISILDSLRGFAILGILLINANGFSFGTWDPTIYDETGLDYFSLYFVQLIPHGAQRALFSLLFGAGIILFIQNLESRLDGTKPADYFFRRQLWLIAFSTFDVYILLWDGDILLDYAIMGMIMFAFRNLPAKKLLIGAAVCMCLMIARGNRDLYLDKQVISKGEYAASLDTTVNKLTSRQRTELVKMHEFKAYTSLEKKKERVENWREKMRGNYWEVRDARTGYYVDTLTRYIYFEAWDILCMMFLGMALFKSGVLLGHSSFKTYLVMFIIGTSLGLLLTHLRLQEIARYNYNYYNITKNKVFEFYELTRVLRTIGFIGLLLMLHKSGLFQWLFRLLQPVGQMAFTNYLMQSLIMGLIFNGYGLGLFGKLHRYETYLIVGGVWLLQIIYSNIWLRYFRFGPCEWLWRSLTYWKVQPFKRNE